MNGLTIELSAAPFRGTAGNGSVLLTARVRGADLVLGPGEPIEVAYRATTTEGETSPGAFHVYNLGQSEGSRAAVESTGLRFVDWLSLPRGRHQVRFAVHQPNGKTGMVVGDVDVPDFVDAPVSISGLVLASERLRTQRTMKMDDALMKLIGGYPTAERSFARRDVLTAYAEVYTRGQTRPPAVVATIAPATRLSDAQRTSPRVVVTEPGRAGYAARVPLDTLRPGDYVLTFEARDGRATATRQVLFTVTALIRERTRRSASGCGALGATNDSRALEGAERTAEGSKRRHRSVRPVGGLGDVALHLASAPARLADGTSPTCRSAVRLPD